MRVLAAVVIAAVGFGGARIARVQANAAVADGPGAEPFAPSPSSAPFLSLGYRELTADLLFVRLRGYFGGEGDSAQGVAALVEAIVAIDPRFLRIYEYGAHAMTLAPGADQDIYMRAIRVLERGASEFPDNYRIPLLAGQIYTQDLVTTDPAQRRVWDERGTLLVESATRKPGAPPDAAHWVAVMRTKLGQHERAAQGLRELALLTNDPKARQQIVDRLAKLEQASATDIANELFEARRQFDEEWKRQRPTLPATYYILLGPRLAPHFDMADLATGGRDLAAGAAPERLEPVTDEPEATP